MEFEVTLAEDYCLKVADGTHDSPKNTESGYKLITSRHLQEFNLDFANANLISNDDYEEINKRSRVDQFDILFSMIGTVGRIYFEKSSDIDYAIKNVGLFKNKSELEAKWLYYYLHSPLAHEYIHQNLRGSTQQYIPLGSLRKFPIKHPKLKKDMKKIVNMLDSIDKKRESNILIISHLEDLAQTLFKHWFVDFEFPNENGEPYKSSGGEMVESELGMIPKDWALSEIGKIAKQNGKSVIIEELKQHVPYIGLEHMPRGSIGLGEWESSEKITSNKTQFKKGDILFGKLRPYFKKVGIAPIEGVCSTDILVLNTKKETYYSYFTSLVSQDVFIEYCTATATGTRMPRTGWKQISKYEIVLPTEDVAEQFNKLLKPFYEKITEAIFETKSLRSMRDTLLPKLLSGEIELPDETEVTENVPVS
ncbi:restriction modification system DNA specificity domain [Bacillus sp. OxB-1]|uniref:restriction endonuclease subunit S n=1 Tax=Bacillus sp. (strain OxB-1) TaxID=98228 RepID=UPI000581F761|nr:restriction endonuclease subunit S [Bacillus sp. OxB-1]BAQ10768.1 restriction modification system DNA specificity domain [Bacillus sp. OxB-1]